MVRSRKVLRTVQRFRAVVPFLLGSAETDPVRFKRGFREV